MPVICPGLKLYNFVIFRQGTLILANLIIMITPVSFLLGELGFCSRRHNRRPVQLAPSMEMGHCLHSNWLFHHHGRGVLLPDSGVPSYNCMIFNWLRWLRVCLHEPGLATCQVQNVNLVCRKSWFTWSRQTYHATRRACPGQVLYNWTFRTKKWCLRIYHCTILVRLWTGGLDKGRKVSNNTICAKIPTGLATNPPFRSTTVRIFNPSYRVSRSPVTWQGGSTWVRQRLRVNTCRRLYKEGSQPMFV